MNGRLKDWLLWRAKRMLSPARLEEDGIRRQVRRFAVRLRGNCLDVGCRSKPYAREIAPFVERHYGIDLVRPRNRATRGPEVLGSALALPFRTASFDSVLCTQVLDDVPEPLQALKEFARILRSGGMLLVTVPQSWGEHDLPHDYWRFTEPGLRMLLTAAGFEIEAVDRRGGVGIVAFERLSAFLYYSWGKGFLPLRIVVVAACAIIQLLGQAVDLLDHTRADTLGYAVLAKRASNAGSGITIERGFGRVETRRDPAD